MGYCGTHHDHVDIRFWFVQETGRAMEALGAVTMEDFRQVLAVFLYRPTVFETKLKELWMMLKGLDSSDGQQAN